MNEKDIDSTIFSQQVLIDQHAINLKGCFQPLEKDYTLKVTHEEARMELEEVLWNEVVESKKNNQESFGIRIESGAF